MLIALSLFLPYLLGLGCLTFLVSPRLLDDLPQSGAECARHLATLLLCGISLNYLLVLVCQGLAVSLAIGCALSIAGLAGFLFRVRRGFFAMFRLGWPAWLAVGYPVLLYALPILLDPIREWDARSIWFFHGKIIFYQHGLDLAQAARETAVSFTHLDYPKLVPVLAAQFAFLAGFWNEFFPKVSLLVLFIPAILGICSFIGGKRPSFFYLILVFLFPFGKILWDGYMDGYLALYFGVALLFWGRWLASRHPRDLLAGALFLGVGTTLKNEGLLCAAAATASLAIMVLPARQKGELFRSFAESRRSFLLLAVPLGNVLVWGWRKSAWGVENDLQLGVGSLPLISDRIAAGKIAVIGTYFLRDAYVGKALIIVTCAFVLAKAVRGRLTPSVWLPVATACVYTAGMLVVYLATPRDLQWHLENSADRTMSTVVISLFAATFFLLRSMEAPAAPLPEPVDAPDGERAQGENG